MGNEVVITVLVDNSEHEGLVSEWGLSLHVQTPQTRVLLDFGQSDAFARNANTLGIDLARVDHAVLSHAHYDHANGMEAFFACNDHAPLHLSEACDENCWSSKGGTTDLHYIGIADGLLKQYERRLVRHALSGPEAVAPGLWLVPHARPQTNDTGATTGMYCRVGCCLIQDAFAHELTLACELPSDGTVVVLSSCSHAGVAQILQEVSSAFPGRRISAFVGGLHLMRASDEDVRHVADAFRMHGVKHIWCGHCTGARAEELLAQELPGRVGILHPGLALTL